MNTILFLCTGNYFRSRFAELWFNHRARQTGLNWAAVSRGLAIERGIYNPGPISRATLARLQAHGVPVEDPIPGPLQAQEADFQAAQRVIAVKQAEHQPLMEARFPAWSGRVSYWHIDDLDLAQADEVLDRLEMQVEDLIRTLA